MGSLPDAGLMMTSTISAELMMSLQESDGTLTWRIKNSWGTSWGEGGYMTLARGLGHCGVGGLFTVPVCDVTTF